MSGKKTPKAKSSSPSTKAKRAPVVVAGNNKGSKKSADLDDGRSGRRVPIQLLVDYKSGGNYLFDFCKDLGTGGVFIETLKPLATGASIDLTFTIPDSKETVNAKGTVIWVQGQVEGRKDLTPGMGVQFQGFSSDQRALLDEFVKRYHGSRQNEETKTKRAG